MRLRTALLGLATGVAVVMTACGNGPPPDASGAGSGSASGGGGAEVPATGTPVATIKETDNLQFQPADASVKVGDIVQFTNGGSASHNVTFADGVASDTMGGNATYSVKFTKAGDYTYICTFHQPGMKGVIHVA